MPVGKRQRLPGENSLSREFSPGLPSRERSLGKVLYLRLVRCALHTAQGGKKCFFQLKVFGRGSGGEPFFRKVSPGGLSFYALSLARRRSAMASMNSSVPRWRRVWVGDAGQVSGHESGFDGFNGSGFQLFREAHNRGGFVQLAPFFQAAGPGEDKGHGVGGGFFSGLVLVVVRCTVPWAASYS